MSNKTKSIELLNNISLEFVKHCHYLPLEVSGSMVRNLASLDAALKGTHDFPEPEMPGELTYCDKLDKLRDDAEAFITANMPNSYDLCHFYKVKPNELPHTEAPQVTIYSLDFDGPITDGIVSQIYCVQNRITVTVIFDLNDSNQFNTATRTLDQLDSFALCQIADQIQRIIDSTKAEPVIDEWSSKDVGEEVFDYIYSSWEDNDLQVTRILCQALTPEKRAEAISYFERVTKPQCSHLESNEWADFMDCFNDYCNA